MKFAISVPLLLTAVIVGTLVSRPQMVCAADPPQSPTVIYDRVVAEYMGGKWVDLEGDLKTNGKRLVSLPFADKQNLTYIGQTFAECRPVWWNGSKAGKQTLVKVAVFGVPIDAVYDPEQKQGYNINQTGKITEITLGWTSAEMDSNEDAEHGFTKGNLTSYGIWSLLGTTAVYTQIPMQSMMNLNEADKLKLSRVVDFRSNVAGIYYSDPKARQWGIFLSMHFFQLKYHKSPTVMSRKAMAAMFAAEVIGHRAQYPSIRLPEKLASENAEETLVDALHDWVEKHHWTLAEDKLMRDAIRTFAVANESVIHTGGPVKLSNGTSVALDPDEDAPFREKRDQWLAQHFSGKK